MAWYANRQGGLVESQVSVGSTPTRATVRRREALGPPAAVFVARGAGTMRLSPREAPTMTDSPDAFYLALEESPGDPVTLQALADWYEEQGHADAAALPALDGAARAAAVPLPPRRRPDRHQRRLARRLVLVGHRRPRLRPRLGPPALVPAAGDLWKRLRHTFDYDAGGVQAIPDAARRLRGAVRRLAARRRPADAGEARREARTRRRRQIEREFGVPVRRRDPRPVAVDADGAEEAARPGPLDLRGAVRPRGAAGRRPGLRQRPLPASAAPCGGRTTTTSASTSSRSSSATPRGAATSAA